MNWKEFLKPTFRKIMIFIVLFVTFISLNIIVSVCGPDKTLSCDTTYNLHLLTETTLFLPTTTFSTIPNFYTVCSVNATTGTTCIPGLLIEEQEIIFNIISIFIYWYILSCLIIWIYDKKLKKVKKK